MRLISPAQPPPLQTISKQVPNYCYYLITVSNNNLFTIPFQQVWIPGDNDIGGENEPIRRNKMEEFEKVFVQPSIITYSNISIYKVNAITHTFPQKTDELPGTDHNFKIAVSHYPVTMRVTFSKMVR